MDKEEMVEKVICVIGGQYGSEGKGAAMETLVHSYSAVCCVRSGGRNAGHTVMCDGHEFKQSMLPCGWIKRDSMLAFSAGAIIDLEMLVDEITAIDKSGVCSYDEVISRVIIDSNAMIMTNPDKQAEGGIDGDLHRKIGSTGEGVGTARIKRIKRDTDNGCVLAADIKQRISRIGARVVNLPAVLMNMYRQGDGAIILEGTQGSGLSMLHSGHYPYCTSHDTNAAQLLADAGMSPGLEVSVVAVLRTYPIRVAGNSGYLYGELSWEELSRRIGKAVTEKTTVTKLTRRVGEWDADLVRRMAAINSPNDIFLTFMDYVDNCEYLNDLPYEITEDQLSDKHRRFIKMVEDNAGTFVRWIKYGKESDKVKELV